MSVKSSQTGERSAGAGGRRAGFSSQPLWLRILFLLSVTLVVIGIVRCSIESTAPVAGAVTRVAVMPVNVDAPEGFFTQPADSVAVIAGTWFMRSFARESGIDVDLVASREEVPSVLAEGSGYDGLAYFTLTRVFDEEREEHRLSIHGEMIHFVTKRPMTTVDYDVPPSFLYRRMTEAGEEMARRMGYDPPEVRGDVGDEPPPETDGGE